MGRRVFVRIAAAVGLVAASAVVSPAVASAAVPVGGGTPILLGGRSACTVSAAGWDSRGRAVAFTAAHCSSGIGEPVTLAGRDSDGVVGRVAARNEVLDYSVIELFGDRGVPVRQQGVVGRGPVPAVGDVVCKDGALTGHTCGVTWQVSDGWIWNQACAGHGDSGGPLVAGDRLVGMISGGAMPPVAGVVGSLSGLLPSCTTPAQSPFFLPALAVSFDKVVADATDRGWPGGGFRMA